MLNNRTKPNYHNLLLEIESTWWKWLLAIVIEMWTRVWLFSLMCLSNVSILLLYTYTFGHSKLILRFSAMFLFQTKLVLLVTCTFFFPSFCSNGDMLVQDFRVWNIFICLFDHWFTRVIQFIFYHWYERDHRSKYQSINQTITLSHPNILQWLN